MPIVTMRLLLLLLVASLLSLSAQPASVQAQDPGDAGPPITLDARWDGSSRFTILVMGLDRRPGARNNFNARADVILIASYSPLEQSVGVLSIPRDLHFARLDTGQLLRVNTLLVEGESLQEGYGPYFAMDTLQNNLGMYIDAYIIFDFEAFITLIDAVGGVEVDVPYAINDPSFPDMNYGISPFFVAPGLQTFSGSRALKYARTRHGDNDYRRGERQLQVVEGVYQRLSDPARLQNLVIQVPALLRELDGHIYSNMAANDVIYVGMSMLTARPENIRMGAIDENRSYDYRHPTLGTVRVPDRNQLVTLLMDVFGESYYLN